ncbi:MAG: NADH-quinone oxidoreductase subunit C [Planctomycetes bacterium]|nr:NADH-quinone oxidoreductase subunit C [Planctomycetota bacterium]
MNDGEMNKGPDRFEERIREVEGQLLDPGRDGMPTARVPANNLVECLEELKEGEGVRFEMLIDVFSVDENKKTPRFDVIYHLRSLKTGKMVRLKVFAEGDPPTVPSAVSVYPTANWHEREAYDMMGIHFEGHPELKRILMPLEYEGHPLRKDYPLEGIEPDRLYRRMYPE